MKDKIYFVYKITNTVNNKIYVGQHYGTITDSYMGSGFILKRAIKKYGIENFKREILEICESHKKVNIREIYYIKELNSLRPNGYNITKGGTGGDTITNHPNWEKIHEKMILHHSDFWKGRKHSEKSKQKIKDHHADFRGKNHPNYGKPSFNKGRSWFNNGVKSVMRDTCPNGYTKGRLPHKRIIKLNKKD